MDLQHKQWYLPHHNMHLLQRHLSINFTEQLRKAPIFSKLSATGRMWGLVGPIGVLQRIDI